MLFLKVVTDKVDRLLNAIQQQSMRRAELQIARYLGDPKAKFTDESERKIERLLLDSQW